MGKKHNILHIYTTTTESVFCNSIKNSKSMKHAVAKKKKGNVWVCDRSDENVSVIIWRRRVFSIPAVRLTRDRIRSIKGCGRRGEEIKNTNRTTSIGHGWKDSGQEERIRRTVGRCSGGGGNTSQGSYTRSKAVMFKYRIWFYIIPTHSPTHTHMPTLAYIHIYTQLRGRACAHSECRLHLFQLRGVVWPVGRGSTPARSDRSIGFLAASAELWAPVVRLILFPPPLPLVCKSSHTSVHYTCSCICVPVRVGVCVCNVYVWLWILCFLYAYTSEGRIVYRIVVVCLEINSTWFPIIWSLYAYI